MKQTLIFVVAIFLFPLLFLSPALASKKKDPKPTNQDSIGFYINGKNQKITMYGIFELTTETVNYNTAKGKETTESVYNIKWLKTGGKIYIGLPRKTNAKYHNLMELACLTDSSILIRSYESYNGSYYYNYYIYNKECNLLVEDTYDYGKTANLTDTVKKYIKGCAEFNETLAKNIRSKKHILADMHAIICTQNTNLEKLLARQENQEWKK